MIGYCSEGYHSGRLLKSDYLVSFEENDLNSIYDYQRYLQELT